MRVIFFIAVASAAFAVTSAYYNNASAPLQESSTELLRTDTRRLARQLNIPGQEYIVRGHSGSRQIIKIPSNARLKVVQPPLQTQQSQRQNQARRHPQNQYNNNNNNFNNNYNHNNNKQQKFTPLYDKPKKANYEEDDYYDDSEYKTPKKPKRPKKGYAVKDVSREEFYEDEEFDPFLKKPKQKGSYSYQQQKTKRYRKPGNKHEYDALQLGSQIVERPSVEEDDFYDFDRPHNKYRGSDEDPFSYEDYAASSITMKQVAPPNLALNVVDPPDLRKELQGGKKAHHDQSERYNDHYQQDGRRQPSSRQIFPQQYTTHNPHVTRNLGVSSHDRSGYNHDREKVNNMEESSHVAVAASNEHRQAVLPAGNSGLHIVKPPQFREPSSSSPTSNQRATIRDILMQDCPDAESLGYCASPPRYPTQQINTIIEKCATLMDAMYSPAPLEQEDDLSSFSSRIDHEMDIEFVDNGHNVSKELEDWVQWSRSSSDSSNTVCDSALSQTEPGYAREVTSNRWFVIMQTLDSIVQRVMTDTCERPGKPCGGLAGLKCSRSASSQHSYKATRCVQRYTQHRLISWDPESPNSCPKIRIFRFPTACLCHLSVD